MNIFARVKEIGFPQNTHVVNAHSCPLTTYSLKIYNDSLSCHWFFALQFQTHTFLPKSFPQSRTSLIHNIIWYRAPIFTFLTFIIVKGKNNKKKKKKRKRKKKPNKQTNKQKMNKKPLLKTPQYFFFTFFPLLYCWLLA